MTKKTIASLYAQLNKISITSHNLSKLVQQLEEQGREIDADDIRKVLEILEYERVETNKQLQKLANSL